MNQKFLDASTAIQMKHLPEGERTNVKTIIRALRTRCAGMFRGVSNHDLRCAVRAEFSSWRRVNTVET